MSAQEPFMPMEEQELSFSDVMGYLEANGKWLLIGIVAGPLLALMITFAFAKYQAEIVMDNLFVAGNAGLGFTEWRSLSETLPIVASQMLEDRQSAGEEVGSERYLGSLEWWAKHAVPTYGLSKSDTKNLAAVEDDLKGQSTRIVNIRISAEGRTQPVAMTRAETAVTYLKKTSLFLRLKNLLKGYQSEAKLQKVGLEKELIDRDIELRYHRDRIESLKALIATQAIKSENGKIVVDVRNGEARYLPLDTQLNALKLEIDGLQEARQRTEEALIKNDILDRFALEATPFLDREKTADGGRLLKELQSVEETLAQGIPESDWIRRTAVERIHGDLVMIESRYSSQMPELSRNVQRKMPWIPALLGGALGGFLIALMATLFLTRYRRYRIESQEARNSLPR